MPPEFRRCTSNDSHGTRLTSNSGIILRVTARMQSGKFVSYDTANTLDGVQGDEADQRRIPRRFSRARRYVNMQDEMHSAIQLHNARVREDTALVTAYDLEDAARSASAFATYRFEIDPAAPRFPLYRVPSAPCVFIPEQLRWRASTEPCTDISMRLLTFPVKLLITSPVAFPCQRIFPIHPSHIATLFINCTLCLQASVPGEWTIFPAGQCITCNIPFQCVNFCFGCFETSSAKFGNLWNEWFGNTRWNIKRFDANGIHRWNSGVDDFWFSSPSSPAHSSLTHTILRSDLTIAWSRSEYDESTGDEGI